MKKNILFTAIILTISVGFLFISAYGQTSIILIPKETPQEKYAIDNFPGSDNTSTELDEEEIAQLVDLIKIGAFGEIHSLIIIHNDNIVLEEYFHGWTRHMLHGCNSITKSLTSALIGIAIDQGLINGVDDKLLTFFPRYDDIENPDERKQLITLEHVLSMSAGFQWDETSTLYTDREGKFNPENDAIKMVLSSDWIKYVLDLPMSAEPGTKFVYNSGCSHLLSAIIENTTGQSAEYFAKENLFNRLGITEWVWEADPNGITTTGWGLYLHPVNMAMFGYLYLNNGRLNGEQIVPEAWVKESTAKHIKWVCNEFFGDYGYQWWRFRGKAVEDYLETNDLFYAWGYLGQYIFIIPHLNMVVVTTAGNFNKADAAYNILFDFILPAVNYGIEKFRD